MTRLRRARLWVAPAAVAIVLAGCGGDDSASSGDGEGGATLDVVASFYPLHFVVERVGGDGVAATNLTPVGTEPHDLELTPQDAASLQDADLVVYLAGFAPAIDDAVDALGTGRAFDVADAARLDLEASGDEHAEEGGDEHAAEGDHGEPDPHFWLDPTRLADVADAVAERLGALDSERAEDYLANAATLRAELERLDGEFADGLASCGSTDLVTSHTAFAYLAERYGLSQVGIAGLSPEEEPSPAQLAEVTEFVGDHDVSTIYFETLVDPAIAETVADETGASTAVLDPIEGLTADSAGTDYFEVMRSNLETMRIGQRCS